ncbi:MAG: hypothetical protein RL410_1250 [Actinomycetota bacterium]|jgi:putative MATE family efflux protein
MLSPAVREVLKIAIPVSLEFVVMLALNFVNQIIVGGLGPIAIAAVGFAGSLTFIVAVTVGAIASSVGVMSSRAFGARREHELNVTVSVAMAIGFVLSAIFVFVPTVWPHTSLLFAGASTNVADSGSRYLQLTALSVIPLVISNVLSAVLRSTDHPRSPMFATTVSVVLNTALGYLLVYGVGPFPELGIEGAGIATLLTSVLKALILWYQAFAIHHTNHWELPQSWDEWKTVVKPLFVLAIPMGLTELVWTLGLYFYNVVLQKVGDLPLAAAQIANTLEGVFIVASLGLMTAGQTLVSRSIGAQDPTEAMRWLRLVKKMALLTSFLFAAIYSSTGLLLPWLYQNAGDQVRHGAFILILINACFQPFRVRNMVLGGAALPSASDMRGIIYGDTAGAFFVGLPLAIALGLFTPLGMYGVAIARGLDEVSKWLIYSYRERKINWHKVSDDHAVASN